MHALAVCYLEGEKENHLGNVASFGTFNLSIPNLTRNTICGLKAQFKTKVDQWRDG